MAQTQQPYRALPFSSWPEDSQLIPTDSEFRHGWRIVLGSTIGLGTGVSLFAFTSSLNVIPLTTEFGWSRGDMSTGSAVAFIAGAIAVPFTGRFVDRLGFRRVAMVCVPLVALIYIVIANQPGPFWFYLAALAALGVVGSGSGALIYTRPVIGWFDRQRGLALGLATAGTSIGIFLAPPIVQEIITSYGWRVSHYALAVLTGLIGLPIALYLIGNPQLRHDAHVAAGEILPAPTVTGLSLKEASRTPRFWLLVAALVCVNIPGSGVVGQLAPLITDAGLSARAVAVIMSLYAVGLLSGRLGCGYCLDRYPPPMIAAIFTLIPAIGCLLLLLPEPSFAIAALAVILIGLQQGSEVDLMAYFISRGFGTLRYGSIYGAIATFGALATAVGLVLFGQVHDATGSYNIALIVAATAFAFGAAAFFAIGRTKTVWVQPPP